MGLWWGWWDMCSIIRVIFIIKNWMTREWVQLGLRVP
jgi:hypothetical protein